MSELYEAAEALVSWLEEHLLAAGRGDNQESLEVEPSGLFWLGRLAPEEAVVAMGLGDRGERIDPCAIGVRIQPTEHGPWSFAAAMSARLWLRSNGGSWKKSGPVDVTANVTVPAEAGTYTFAASDMADALRSEAGADVLRCEFRVEVSVTADGAPELTVLLVNTSPESDQTVKDTNLYECSMSVAELDVRPYILESLPDSFRYDRRIPAYGINCGIVSTRGTIQTTDTVVVDRKRPRYWSLPDALPDLSFSSLSEDPLPSFRTLVGHYSDWGAEVWSTESLDQRARDGDWSAAMRAQADVAAREFQDELGRMRGGIEVLEENPALLQALKLANEAILHSSSGKYDGWRPFQIGFLLANLRCLTDQEERELVDIVWFATGGGKTETYLGLLVTAALYDRLCGKLCGVTAWSRFPLRMLSLQQTQRFADAFAGAELARRQAGIDGEPFSVGFLVGKQNTPNEIRLEPRQGEPDPDDEQMPRHYQVLLYCPFCRADIEMHFNRRAWTLEHRCTSDMCPWDPDGLPFYIVDMEVYRFLPTVIVGTLDKAASISMQAAMRGLVGAPLGRCSRDGHGFTYKPRSKRPNGCLVPECRGQVGPLNQPPDLFGPSFRLQDELHLLKDSLGAVDSHYESLLDHLQEEICGRKPKILASSATLEGYEQHARALYNRNARVFPAPGPSVSEGFWTSETDELARRFVAVAPRGVTLEYTVDRMMTELQKAVRMLEADPMEVCAEIGVDPSLAPQLLKLYGTDVLYGNTLRDLEASIRSLETQVPVDPLNTATLTGRTGFDDVRATLERLNTPEEEFSERLHIIAASSMMSHGVDVDRLNIMVMLGIPLTTSEFIQSTARVGRRWPGLTIVLHKIARERDASVFRSFMPFVAQGDRFIEPIPITRRSRKVLERTVAGLELARILALHEPASDQPLTLSSRLKAHFEQEGITTASELAALTNLLGVDGALDAPLRDDLEDWLDQFFNRLIHRTGDFRFPSDLCPGGRGPMISLRDVEEQAPVYGTIDL